MARDILYLETDIIEAAKKILQEQGYEVSEVQLRYLLSVIAKYMGEKTMSPDVFGIILPFLGTAYTSTDLLDKEVNKAIRERDHRLSELLAKKNNPNLTTCNESIHNQVRLSKKRRFNGGLPFRDVISNQNSAYGE